jgi:hypothetical protein
LCVWGWSALPSELAEVKVYMPTMTGKTLEDENKM